MMAWEGSIREGERNGEERKEEDEGRKNGGKKEEQGKGGNREPR